MTPVPDSEDATLEFEIKQEELESDSQFFSDLNEDPREIPLPDSPEPDSIPLPDSPQLTPVKERSVTLSDIMAPRTLDPNKFVSSETKTLIKKKSIPQQESKNAPVFKKSRIIDFFLNMELLFSNHEIEDDGAKIELAALYAGADNRDAWFVMPEYADGDWEAFRKAVLASYSKGPGDIKYSIHDLRDAISEYKEEKAGTKKRWMACQREVVHILKYLVKNEDITEKAAVEHIRGCLKPVVWDAVFTGLRTKALQKQPPPEKITFNIDEVVSATSTYFNSGIQYAGVKTEIEEGEFGRSLMTPGTAKVKLEDLQDMNNLLASFRDTINAQEKRINETPNMVQKLLEMVLQNQREPRQQAYAAEPSAAYYQQPMYNMAIQSNRMPDMVRQGPGMQMGHGNHGSRGFMNDGCFYCEDPAHFIETCEQRKKDEQEGWIFKPENVRWFFLKNGKSIPRKAISGVKPSEFVRRFKEEQLKNIRAQNAMSNEEDYFAPDDFTYDGQAVFLTAMGNGSQQGFN